MVHKYYRDLIDEVAKETGMKRAVVEKIVMSEWSFLRDSIISGELKTIWLRGFGRWTLRRKTTVQMDQGIDVVKQERDKFDLIRINADKKRGRISGAERQGSDTAGGTCDGALPDSVGRGQA